MKWMSWSERKADKIDRFDGKYKILRKFLFLPRKREGEWRWLSTEYLVYQFKYNPEWRGNSLYRREYCWQAVEDWFDEDSMLRAQTFQYWGDTTNKYYRDVPIKEKSLVSAPKELLIELTNENTIRQIKLIYGENPTVLQKLEESWEKMKTDF